MAQLCRNCNTELNRRAKFCRMCGTPIEAPSSDIKPNNGIKDEGWIPATERLAYPNNLAAPLVDKPAKPAERPVDRLEIGQKPGTAKTEPALLDKFLAGKGKELKGQDSGIQHQEPGVQRQETGKEIEQPIAPATHAIIGAFEQAGFSLRFGAFLFDLLILIALLFSIEFVANLLGITSRIFERDLLIAVAFYSYNFIWLAGKSGQTLGKRLIGIRILDINQKRATMRQILIRHLLAYPLSFAAGGLGFLWLLWDRNQQGWHDKLAHTLVIKKRLNW